MSQYSSYIQLLDDWQSLLADDAQLAAYPSLHKLMTRHMGTAVPLRKQTLAVMRHLEDCVKRGPCSPVIQNGKDTGAYGVTLAISYAANQLFHCTYPPAEDKLALLACLRIIKRRELSNGMATGYSQKQALEFAAQQKAERESRRNFVTGEQMKDKYYHTIKEYWASPLSLLPHIEEQCKKALNAGGLSGLTRDKAASIFGEATANAVFTGRTVETDKDKHAYKGLVTAWNKLYREPYTIITRKQLFKELQKQVPKLTQEQKEKRANAPTAVREREESKQKQYDALVQAETHYQGRDDIEAQRYWRERKELERYLAQGYKAHLTQELNWYAVEEEKDYEQRKKNWPENFFWKRGKTKFQMNIAKLNQLTKEEKERYHTDEQWGFIPVEKDEPF